MNPRRLLYLFVLGASLSLVVIYGYTVAEELVPRYFPDTHLAQFLLGAPSQNPWNKKVRVPFVSLVSALLPLENAFVSDELEISFHTEPSRIQAGSPTLLMWDVQDRKGNRALLDQGIHNALVHVYLVREDLRGGLVHLHPPQDSRTGNLKISTILNTPGKWHLISQMGRGGIFYHLTTTPLIVHGEEVEPFTPPLTREVKGQRHLVRLDTFPSVPPVGLPTILTLTLEPIQGERSAKLNFENSTSHNLLFAHEKDGLLWNAHGDKSVDHLSGWAGMPAILKEIKKNVFTYEVTFPSSGLWFLQFELEGIHNFFLQVAG